MKTKSFGKMGQAVLEYAILLSLVSAAFLAMSVYVRRAVQGKIYDMEETVSGKQIRPPRVSPPGW